MLAWVARRSRILRHFPLLAHSLATLISLSRTSHARPQSVQTPFSLLRTKPQFGRFPPLCEIGLLHCSLTQSEKELCVREKPFCGLLNVGQIN